MIVVQVELQLRLTDELADRLAGGELTEREQGRVIAQHVADVVRRELEIGPNVKTGAARPTPGMGLVRWRLKHARLAVMRRASVSEGSL